MVKEKKILKTSTVKVLYKERYDFKEFFVHMFQRGPRFVDYYWDPKSKYFFVIPIIFLLPFLLIGGVVFLKAWFYRFGLSGFWFDASYRWLVSRYV